MSRSDTKVIVVGAGPAGVSLAYLLASRGVSVTLLERHRDFSREFRGEVLLPSGLEALQQMGLGDVVTTIPHVAPTAFELYANARPVFRIRLHSESFGAHAPTAVSQPAFLKAVIERARAFPHFRVELGVTVRGLLRTDGRVEGVTVRSQIGSQTLHSDLVVGADGRNSVIRRACDLDVRKHGLDFDIVWFKMPPPAFLGGQSPLRAYVGRGHLLIAYLAADGLLQVAWIITKGTYGELRRRGISEWVEEMAHHVTPDLGVHLRTHSRSLTDSFLLSTVSDRVTSWSVPGVLVIGDAAHTMSPVGAQGINIALRDAIVAANHLVPVLRQTSARDRIVAATQAIERERTPELARIQRFQAIPPRLVMGHTFWGAAFRATVPRLLRFEAVRERAAPVMRPILFGHGDVRLQV